MPLNAAEVRKHGKVVVTKPYGKTQERVLSHLSANKELALTQSDVAKALKLTPQRARGALMSLCKKQVIERKEMGKASKSGEHIFYMLKVA